jgi:hypothetical protein
VAQPLLYMRSKVTGLPGGLQDAPYDSTNLKGTRYRGQVALLCYVAAANGAMMAHPPIFHLPRQRGWQRGLDRP